MEYKFDNEELGVSFEVVERPTVRLQLLYKGTMGMAPGDEVFIRLWEAAKTLITEWECEHIELDADIDKLDSTKAADVIEFAGLAVFGYVSRLDEISKNS